MKIRRTAVSLLAIGLLAGLTACNSNGDSSNTSDGGSTVSQSDSTTSDSTGGGDSSGTALTKDTFAQAVRDAQAQAGSAHVEATIETQGQNLTLSGDVDKLDDPAASETDMTASFGGQSFHMILVDKVLYMSGDALAGAGNGKKWVKIDLSDPSNPLGQLFQSSDPSNFSAYLEGVKTFEDKGQETVDGVSTEHYVVTIDTKKMMANNPMFKGQSSAALGLPKTLTSDVYVDGDNRPVEIKLDLGAGGAFEAHFSDYGKDVSITAPPANQVSTFNLGG